tara:strand:- start:290 stop:994 length:705 start_codon:yes stop_codon:yes gene_type:complete
VSQKYKEYMIWDDIGFLLTKNRYNENSLIVEIFTKKHGKVSGIIFGGTSKKIKNYLQIGNNLYVSFNSKSENKIGYFKVEINKAYSPYYFDNQQKLLCISSAMNLIKILNADSQSNHLIYSLIENFYLLLEKENWLKNYIYWELELLKILGYDLDFKDLVEKKFDGDKFQYITKSLNFKRIVPNFLIDKNQKNEKINILLDGLRLISDYLDKTILKPNNLNHPINRLHFINTLK